MKLIVLLCAISLSGCAATNSWLGVNSGAVSNSTQSSNSWDYRTTTVITPQGSFLVNRAGNTATVIRTAK